MADTKQQNTHRPIIELGTTQDGHVCLRDVDTQHIIVITPDQARKMAIQLNFLANMAEDDLTFTIDGTGRPR